MIQQGIGREYCVRFEATCLIIPERIFRFDRGGQVWHGDVVDPTKRLTRYRKPGEPLLTHWRISVRAGTKTEPGRISGLQKLREQRSV